MGTLLASTIVSKAATILFDINGVEWNQAELLGWLSDGQRQITMIKPDANNVTAAVPLVAGTRQSIPADGWTLLDVYRNLGAGGATPGRAMRLVAKKLLDQFSPTWHSATPVAVPTEFAFDGHDQTRFWVNPPSDATTQVEVNYSQSPANIATLGTVITLNDIFEPMLLDYVLYRAGQKDVDYSPGPSFAAVHWSAFMAALTAKSAAEMATDPNAQLRQHAPPAAVAT